MVTSVDGERAFAVSIDSTYMYVSGEYGSGPDWRIEKRRLDTGALDPGFGTAGVVTSVTDSQTAWESVIDATSIYVVGYTHSPDWRIEKRSLANGALRAQNQVDVGAPLADRNTAGTSPAQGTPFRLRMLVHVGNAGLAISGQSFRLQFAARSGTCDPGFVGESYADVTAASVIRFYGNPVAADGWPLTLNYGDPTHGTDTVMPQTYEELNDLTNSVSAIAAGQDGLWDFALVDATSPPSTAYCFRLIRADGTPLETYTVIPEITTP